MDLNFIKQIVEVWVVQWLFILIVVGFIWKWIPFIVKEFTEINTNFLIAVKEQQELFKTTLQSISDDFVKRVEASERWHETHSKQLDEIKNILAKK